MAHCPTCDELGPHPVGPTTYAFIELHRAMHHMGRHLLAQVEKLIRGNK